VYRLGSAILIIRPLIVVSRVLHVKARSIYIDASCWDMFVSAELDAMMPSDTQRHQRLVRNSNSISLRANSVQSSVWINRHATSMPAIYCITPHQAQEGQFIVRHSTSPRMLIGCSMKARDDTLRSCKTSKAFRINLPETSIISDR
jgi:hypothetical protein